MIIPYRDEVLIRIYRCGICSGLYQARADRTHISYAENISCAVNHPPGTCCHFHEKLLLPEQLQEVFAVLKEIKYITEVKL